MPELEDGGELVEEQGTADPGFRGQVLGEAEGPGEELSRITPRPFSGKDEEHLQFLPELHRDPDLPEEIPQKPKRGCKEVPGLHFEGQRPAFLKGLEGAFDHCPGELRGGGLHQFPEGEIDRDCPLYLP